ncbi:MAG: 30S ribosomal protein S6 [Dehalococcoidia bacterium]|nr:30S ribosomal protein S6 [Dehalococcoidia bacterium]
MGALHEYDLVLILSPEIEDGAVPATVERVSQFVQNHGGEVVQSDHWGRRRLAYPIKRHNEGNYVRSQVKLAPERAGELEASLRITEDILRHLLVRKGT